MSKVIKYSPSQIEAIFVCPSCGGDFLFVIEAGEFMGIPNGKLHCLGCGSTFHVNQGVFYLSDEAEKKTRGNGKIIWEKDKFDNMYPEGDYYKSHSDWLERRSNLSRRVAKIVGEYENSLIKGRFLDWIEPEPGNVIVDIGCGVGFFLFDLLYRHTDKDIIIIGTDVFSPIVESLNIRKHKEHAFTILPVVADAENLPFRKSSIDIVTSSEVLEHIFTPKNAIEEMNRILKDNGKCFISTPNKRGSDFWEKITLPSRKLRALLKISTPSLDFYDVPLTIETLKNHLETTGFRIQNFELNIKVLSRKIAKLLPGPLAIMIINFLEESLVGEKFGMHMVTGCEKINKTD